MTEKIRVGAVSYLNTKPLLYGIEGGPIINDIELVLDYPSRLAAMLASDDIDMALLPVAAMPGIPGARIVSEYGIAASGTVASVAIFSQVPIEQISNVYLDYQSRTSVRLAQLLLRHFWKQEVNYLQAPANYIEQIDGATAGVIIGDRALQQLANFEYVYDLAEAWKTYTGLDFVFAAWVANKSLPPEFIVKFNEANAAGLSRIDEIVAATPFPAYNLNTYYNENIRYLLDEAKRLGLAKFLSSLNEQQD